MVTVKDIMKLDIIKNQMTLLGGEKGLHKAVNYITIMEAPDFYKWVSGGELVLTSWYAYSKDPTGQEFAFSELAKHISCIGIKVNRFLNHIPQSLIQLANKYEVPLFAIEHDTKFREIIQAVSNELQNFQTNILIKVEKHYNELIQATLASDDFSVVLRTTAKHIGKSCHCFNADGKYLGGFIVHSEHKKKILDIKTFYNKHLENRTEEYSNAIHINIDGYSVFTCIARKHLLGFFIVENYEELTEPSLLIAQQTVSVLSLKLLDGYANMQKRLVQLLADIKQGHVTNEKLAAFGLKRDAKYFYAACLMSASQNIEDLVGETSFLKNTDRILSIIDEKKVIFIGITNKGLPGEVPRSIQAMLSWINKNDLPIVLGMGTRVLSIDELPISHYLACATASAAIRMGASGLAENSDWLIPAFVINQLNSIEFKQIEKNILQPILKYDADNKTELFLTLKTFVKSSKTDITSSILHIHVNTLRYRLAKIRELTGYDPSNLQHLNILLLAVMIAELKIK